jgi:hypothetical protein
MKSKLLAREYLYFLACILLTLLGWIGIFVWNKYWRAEYERLNTEYSLIVDDYMLLNGVFSEYHRNVRSTSSLKEFVNDLVGDEAYANEYFEYIKSFDYGLYYEDRKAKDFIEKFPNFNSFRNFLTRDGQNISEVFNTILENKERAFDNILYWSEEDLKGWSGFNLYELDPNSLDISEREKSNMRYDLEDYEWYYDRVRMLYIIPIRMSDEFEGNFEYSVSKGWEAGDVLTIKVVLIKIFLFSFLVLFGVRYFIWTVRWSFKAIRTS